MKGVRKNIMSEKPILFNSEMVKAILEGRKTQTRRILKPQPYFIKNHWRIKYHEGEREVFDGPFIPERQINMIYGAEAARAGCPQGQVGDTLWVRETIKTNPEDIYYAANGMSLSINLSFIQEDWIIDYGNNPDNKTIPSIHMPRWASRITLEITNIQVERLQDISEEDARAEGCGRYPDYNSMRYEFRYSENEISSANFHILWDSINKKRGYGWDVNPWVWVITFEVMK